MPRSRLLARLLRSPWTEFLCRYPLAAVMLMAGVTKLLDLDEFTDLLVLRAAVPVAAARVLAPFLAWVEVTCAFCLVLNSARREAAVVLAVLLVLFTGYGFLGPAEADCGCFLFPPVQPVSGARWWPVVRDLLLLACAARVAWEPVGPSEKGPAGDTAVSPASGEGTAFQTRT